MIRVRENTTLYPLLSAFRLLPNPLRHSAGRFGSRALLAYSPLLSYFLRTRVY